MAYQDKYIEDIESKGFCYIQKGGEFFLRELVDKLGYVIQEKNILVEEKYRKWSTSTKAMPLHTDHSRVDFVAWHCIEQTDKGGETLLSDASIVFNQLSPNHKEILKKVELKNVQLFEKDLPFNPLMLIEENKTKFYFVPWLIKENESKEVEDALNELHTKLKENMVTLRLEKEDLLIIDNTRILHGRNPITGLTDRLLKRYWIKANNK